MEKPMITNVLKTLGSLRATLVAAAGIPFLIAASAFAQNDLNSAPSVGGEATGERIVVTGSYIPTAETVTASPVDTLSSAGRQNLGCGRRLDRPAEAQSGFRWGWQYRSN